MNELIYFFNYVVVAGSVTGSIYAIGAVGVTGDTQERDDELALYGIRAAALLCDEDCASLGNKVRLD